MKKLTRGVRTKSWTKEGEVRMYSYEERMRAVQLYIKYEHSLATVMRELGYPSHQALLKWYREFIRDGDLKKKSASNQKYTDEQKEIALKHYLEHGKCIARTARVLGYPSRQRLQNWVDDAFPDRKKRCVCRNALVELSQEHKEQAVVDLHMRTCTAQEIADKYSVTRTVVYKWSNQLLKVGGKTTMQRKNDLKETPFTSDGGDDIDKLMRQKDALEKQVEALEADVHRLRLERDILKKADEILKKGQGINLEMLTNREKAVLIGALRDKYRLKELLSALHMSKSSYCYQTAALHSTDKYTDLRQEMKKIFEEAHECYGYRRIHSQLQRSGICVSEKVVRRIMKEEHLTVYLKRRKKYSSYIGEVTPAVANIINHNFHAEKPNCKWLTDITEFGIPSGKVYLSPMIDCFDGFVVSWTIGTSPSADLANGMLDEAVSMLDGSEHPIIHSDRGGHYRWPGWIERMNRASLTRSMSKKGCSPDNSACEGFFGRLKNEMFYGRDWMGVSIEEFISRLDAYIHWYNETRIKLSLGGMSPLEYRRSLGLLA